MKVSERMICCCVFETWFYCIIMASITHQNLVASWSHDSLTCFVWMFSCRRDRRRNRKLYHLRCQYHTMWWTPLRRHLVIQAQRSLCRNELSVRELSCKLLLIYTGHTNKFDISGTVVIFLLTNLHHNYIEDDLCHISCNFIAVFGYVQKL